MNPILLQGLAFLIGGLILVEGLYHAITQRHDPVLRKGCAVGSLIGAAVFAVPLAAVCWR